VAPRVGAVLGVSSDPLSRDDKTEVMAGAVASLWFNHDEVVVKKPEANASAVQSRAAPVTGKLVVIHTRSHPWSGQKPPY